MECHRPIPLGAFRFTLDQGLLLAFALPQVGEFAFVLFAFAQQEGVLDATITSPLVAAVAVSMALTPLLLLVFERVLRPRVGTRREATPEADLIEEENRVIVAGFDSFGSTVGRLLKANGVETTVLDVDSDRVELLRRLGLKVYYGDASRYDLLYAAGAERARLAVLALDSPEKTLQLARTGRKHFPHVTILARAFEWNDAHDLIEAGVTHVCREALDTSLRMGTDAMRLLGFRAYQSHRAADKFLRHEEESLRELTGRRKGDGTAYINAARAADRGPRAPAAGRLERSGAGARPWLGRGLAARRVFATAAGKHRAGIGCQGVSNADAPGRRARSASAFSVDRNARDSPDGSLRANARVESLIRGAAPHPSTRIKSSR